MKTFKNTAAQGEIFIERVAAIPADAKKIKPTDGKYIIGHSETGHHHVIEAASDVEFFEATENGMRVLYGILDNPGHALEHLRSFDTHEPIVHDAGVFRYGTLVERDPYADLIRQQAD